MKTSGSIGFLMLLTLMKKYTHLLIIPSG